MSKQTRIIVKKSYNNNSNYNDKNRINTLRLDKIELKMDKIIGMLYDILRLGR